MEKKKWTGPARRHDAPSPQSSIRRSWTRSFGSQHAARPEGPMGTRSSSKPRLQPALLHLRRKTVRNAFFFLSFFRYNWFSGTGVWVFSSNLQERHSERFVSEIGRVSAATRCYRGVSPSLWNKWAFRGQVAVLQNLKSTCSPNERCSVFWPV